MVMTTAHTTGADRTIAEQVAAYHHDGVCDGVMDLPSGVGHLASGQHRVCYVDYDTDTVYKLAKEGQESANRCEHATLTHWREQGAEWAPPTELFEVLVDGAHGPVACTVVAMPYLPEDGSVDHVGVVIPVDGDFNPANVVAHDGSLWLIDAGGC